MNIDELKTKLKRAHLRLMKHPETCLYAGTVLMGESSVVIDANVTAYTDGFNKRYGTAFIEPLNELELTGLVFHENLHVVLKHIPRHLDLIKEDRKLANAAMDYVVNDIIMSLEDKTLCQLPEGGHYDPMFHNWSVREVWDFLKTGKSKDGKHNGKPEKSKGSSGGEAVDIEGKTYELEGFDEHDEAPAGAMDDEQAKKLSDDIDEGLRHGALLAGRFGTKVPRVITDMLEPKVNWKQVLRDFISNSTKGKDEYTWRRFNRRRVADDIFMPSTEDETVGEIVIAIDTSGSIGGAELAEFTGELASICTMCEPERVRVLWWDTKVHGEQIFKGNYENIAKMLKPVGGGGTRVSCVSEHLNKNKIKADCVLVFTDGYVEGSPAWNVPYPTLWLVTSNKGFVPPAGKLVIVNRYN
jgi:predicted metal-dependent peptidase